MSDERDDFDDDLDDDADDDFNRRDPSDNADLDDDDVDDDEVEGAETAEAVLEYLVSQLVDEPDAIDIDVDEHRGRVRFDVSVAPGDMGRVIGRRGRTAQAIRGVVRAAAAKDEADVEVEFVD